MLILASGMFERSDVWAQIEAARAFGYDAVMTASPADEAVKSRADKLGLKLYEPSGEIFDPETCSDIRQGLARATAVRLHDYGTAHGARQNRRIGHGVLDWQAVFDVIRETDWHGDLIVDARADGNPAMEDQRALAEVSAQDVARLLRPRAPMANWHAVSPDVRGLHTVIAPERSDCLVSRVLRLNLCAGERYTLESGDMEMNAILISGRADASCAAFQSAMGKLDSFYIPGHSTVEICASEDCSFYIAAAVCEGFGRPFFRKFDLTLPIGDIHQMHGSGSGLREVFFTLDPAMPSSRLLCGLTWSQDGRWTSWPPHQHENDLEEVYCYFDMPAPQMGFHGSYSASGDLLNTATLHPVQSGHMVLAPRGYHPTVATPGTTNAYFWVLTAFSHQQRRYDLAVNDPAFS